MLSFCILVMEYTLNFCIKFVFISRQKNREEGEGGGYFLPPQIMCYVDYVFVYIIRTIKTIC